MDSKKGIRIKTKQVSLVDNIVNFFKPIDVKANPNPQPHQQEPTKDASPRSTTPRKKIFDKTPEKAGKINLSNLNNKSMDHAYEITFNDQLHNFKQQQSRSQLSPPKRFKKPITFEDTQFNKLILGNSQVSMKKGMTPQKTYLSEVPSSNRSINSTSQAQRGNVQFPRVQGGVSKPLQKQLEYHKKLVQQCLAENQQLKRENQHLRVEVQSLRKVIKGYELSSMGHNGVPIVNLQPQNITSPLQKVSPFSPDNKIAKNYQNEKSFQQNDRKRQQMKQSIPIMPQIPNEYSEKGKSPKIGQTSFLSSDLRNRSHDGSFMQSQKSIQNLPGFSMLSHNNQNDRFLSPLEKTVYDKTMKPQERQRKKKAKEQKEQISFSKTIGYIKGDQPINSNKNQNTSLNHNPFEEIATQSNKFLFQNSNNPSVSNNNSFRVEEKSNKGFNGREWVVFTQGQNSLGYSSNSNSINSLNRQSVSPNNFNKNTKNQTLNQTQNKSKDNKMHSPKHQHSMTQKMKIQGSKTYKFQDFDANDQDSSYVDYF